MYEALHSPEAEQKPKIHELRVAVFSLSQRALIGSFSSPELFRDVQPLKENGMISKTHEQRATTLFNSEYLRFEVPPLKMLGRLGTILVTEEDGSSFNVTGVAVSTSRPYDFRRFHFKRYEIDELESHANKELETPGSTNIDVIDAQFISEAVNLTRNTQPRRETPIPTPEAIGIEGITEALKLTNLVAHR